MTVSKPIKVPHHVAIIMDGNGRWAQNQGQVRVFGHHSGAKRVREIVETAGNCGVKCLTLYAFSEENWRRPEEEIHALMSLLVSYLQEELAHLKKHQVRLKSIGCIEKLPEDCRVWLRKVEEETAESEGLTLVLALSYSGRSDMIRAVRKLAQRVKNAEIQPEDIREVDFTSSLSTHDIPDPDLLIRTSGEMRLSNFLLWEMAYTEFYFTPIHWPDFDKKAFLSALQAFGERDRRFGALSPPET